MIDQTNANCSTELSHFWYLSHTALLSSFELSAYFMSVFHERARHYEVTLPDVLTTSACPSCGTVWVPGWTCSIRLQRSSAKRYWRQKKAIRAKQPPPQLNYWVQYCCQRCHRIFRFQREKHVISKLQCSNESSPSFLNVSKGPKTRAEQNMASRRRKKLRLGGLQGMLDRMIQEDASRKEKELSLDDFML
ncbi:unnamed protein product [Pneumocystis jirovecii]|uniref:Uncharacterized protein n=2 Tax=Pneumocystis jirovecii TaxID=42068 RepID=L0PHD4_PNEJI|nr:uncharacterized protein T551_03005 [Pneumocystis jirovecii RU7]KTW27506.1 hypothetical protein T551_03005 [Pneumocystis jirovecii RU7]CCJ31065.1 unnamed protein product [Pneumocystis jirovecii]